MRQLSPVLISPKWEWGSRVRGADDLEWKWLVCWFVKELVQRLTGHVRDLMFSKDAKAHRF